MQSIISSEIFVITLAAGVYLAVPENEVGAVTSFVSFYSGVSGGDECDRDAV